jgi:hypothetical protein
VIGKHFKIVVPEHYKESGLLVREHVVRFKVIDVEGDTALVMYRNGNVGSLKIENFQDDPDYLIYDRRGNKIPIQKKAAQKYSAKKRKRKSDVELQCQGK